MAVFIGGLCGAIGSAPVSIYKPCGISGDADRELNADLYRSWGRSLGSELAPNAKFVVGGDMRSSTPEFLGALVEGLCQSGLDVVDLGQIPTPMICYARHRLGADGCAIVTGSHKAGNINGLRWMIGGRLPMPDDVYALQVAAERPAGNSPVRPPRDARTIDISFDYVANLQETWMDAMGAQEVQERLGRSMLAGDPPRRVAAGVNACTALRDLLQSGSCYSDDASMAGTR